MEGEANKHPSFDLFIVKSDPDALVVGLYDRHIIVCGHEVGEIFQHLSAGICKIFTCDLESDFCLFRRMTELIDQLFDASSFLSQTSHLTDNFYTKISAVIREVILAECSVSGRLNSQRAVFAFFCELNTFVDDIFIPALETKMCEMQLIFNEVMQLVGRDT